VARACEVADQKATKEGKASQRDDPWLFDPSDDADIPIDGQRVPLKKAKWEQIRIVLEQSAKNLNAQRRADSRKRREAEKLRPYMEGTDVNVEEAVNMFRRDHPLEEGRVG
jgi:hypothetical protein